MILAILYLIRQSFHGRRSRSRGINLKVILCIVACNEDRSFASIQGRGSPSGVLCVVGMICLFAYLD